MTTIYTTKGEGVVGARCDESMSALCDGLEIVPVGARGSFLGVFTEAAKNPNIDETTVADVARLLAVCLNGGVSVSGDTCLVAQLKPMVTTTTPFCASTKSSSPLPCVFGFNQGDLVGELLVKGLIEAVARGIDSLVSLQNSTGILQSLFSRPEVASLFHFLPYQRFAVFGIQANAVEFVLANEVRRHQILDQIYGRIEEEPMVGVFAGQQRHAAPPGVTGIVRNSARSNKGFVKPSDSIRVKVTPRQMASGIIGAAKSVARQVVRGESISVSGEERVRRLSICTGGDSSSKCEFFNEDRGVCSKCGCFMKFKTRLSSQSCPEGKW